MTEWKIAITPGEPAGIGPDIVLSLNPSDYPSLLVVVASKELLVNRARKINLTPNLVDYIPGKPCEDYPDDALAVLDVHLSRPAVSGQMNIDNAGYVIECLSLATEGCLNNKFQALVTGPVNKALINQAGLTFSGHTEWLAKRTDTEKTVMMLATDKMRVALLTTHIPLSQVPSMVTDENLSQCLYTLNSGLKYQFQIPKPKILVCGLNPHAGEGGYIGHEDMDIIEPTILRLQEEGFDITGPLSADTIFTAEHLKSADVILSMYHDQGLPVLKYQGFHKAVNITLGLPFVRTSVDHGTALALAGTGKADHQSLDLAIKTAFQMQETLNV